MKNLLILIVTCFWIFESAFCQKSNTFIILEKAGKQKMLVEQMTKNYLMIVSNIKIDEANIEFDQSKSEFNENCKYLEATLTSELTKPIISNVLKKWSLFKEKISGKPSFNEIDGILLNSELLILDCNELLTKTYIENDFKNARILNLCNKQKSNIQKIAKNFVVINGKFTDNTKFLKSIEESIISFEFSLSLLKNYRVSDVLFADTIKKTELEWHLIKESFDNKSTSYSIDNVLNNSEKIYRLINNLTTIIENNSIPKIALTKL